MAQTTPKAPFTISATTRARVEVIENQARTGFERDDTLVTFRTVISAEYGPGPISVGGELWDSRAYSISPRSPIGTGEVNAIELVQAYVKADLGGALGTKVQAGRFTLDVGSRRIVANDDYRNTTNGFTGLRVDLAPSKRFNAMLFYTLPQVRLPAGGAALRANHVEIDRESFDLRFWGASGRLKHAIGPFDFDAAWLRLDERDRPDLATRDRHLTTLNARLIKAPAAGQWDAEGEISHQGGSVSADATASAARLPVSAWSTHGEIGYTFAAAWKPRLSFEYEFAAGDDRGGHFTRFDPIFGSRRGDYAPSGIYSTIGRANIVTPAIRLETAPSKRFDTMISYRELWLASRYDAFSTSGVRDATGASGSYAGRQFEGRIRWWAIPKRLQLEASGALLDKGRFLKNAPNAPVGGDTRYLSLNASAFF
ncbi:alginate export family protein [Sphingomonas sp. UYAg733]